MREEFLCAAPAHVHSAHAASSKLESLSPNSRWILYNNTGSAEVEREARQPRARQRHLRRGEPPDTRFMMSGVVCTHEVLCVLRTARPPPFERVQIFKWSAKRNNLGRVSAT